jgi:hypothetical protein
MFGNAADEIIRNTDIECPIRTIGEDINVAAHRPMIASVDGRDKPGHDG